MKLLIKINHEESEDFLKTKYREESSDEGNSLRLERGDAGFDLYFPEDVTFKSHKMTMVDLGIACEGLSDNDSRNVCYSLECRSSISKTPLRLANSRGIIDAGYRGNLMVAIDNISDEAYSVQRGMRLFQICGRYLESINVDVVDELSDSIRGNDGFGSTGN
jgi:dUTP pyrophosphatase